MKNILPIILLLLVSSCCYVEDLGYIYSNRPQTGPTVGVPGTIANATWVKNKDTIKFTTDRFCLTRGDTLTIEGEFHYKTPEGYVYFEKKDNTKDGWSAHQQNNFARYDEENIEKPILVVNCIWNHYTNGSKDKSEWLSGIFYKK
jgi:hypothetical protein